MVAPLVTQADVEARFPPSVVRRMFCDDGSGLAGPRLALALDEASRQAEAILLGSWSLAQIALLVANDSAVMGAICRLVIGIGAEGKPEWSGEGAPYATIDKKGRQMLVDIQKTALGSRGEAVAGANTVGLARVSNPNSPPRMFTPSNGDSGAGGGF